MKPIVLALLALAAPSFAGGAKNPDTFVYLSISDAETLDPAWAYDAQSNLIIQNIYEPLFFYEKSSTEKLVPLLAEKVPSRANGLISEDGKTYRIPIRRGVRFQDGTPMTAEDARYSLLRFLLQDRDAGPSALLLEPLLGYASTRDEKGALKPEACGDAFRAVRAEGNDLILRLPKPFAPLLSILAIWSPVVSRIWAVKNGDWDGAEGTCARFNNLKKEASPFFERANGTGPFKLERWDKKDNTTFLVRNDGYWRGPAKLKRVVVKAVPEFATRKLMLQAGDADVINAERPDLSKLQDIPGVRIIDGLSLPDMNPIVFFSFQINPTANPNIGSGKLDGEGIPPDFFLDKDVRKGFAYSLDYGGYIKDVFRGKAVQALGCLPRTLPGFDPSAPHYSFDPKKAEEHLRRAWGGRLWDAGFHFTLAYNAGNVPRQNLCQMLKRQLESLNPRFKIDVRPIEWAAFLDQQRSGKLPIFVLGWGADYPDPHNFAFPILHSQGYYPQAQKYQNEEMDRLVEAAVAETELSARKKIYARILRLAYEDVPHLVVLETLRARVQRSWVRGFEHRPIFPGTPHGSYFYSLSKQ
ncbi:MAG: ABC transporter substrate-binding protein [Elusimicrobia bacterium]|nr:ABC transporter substrate-binding protein [Elusimicrobiota bacterium]